VVQPHRSRREPVRGVGEPLVASLEDRLVFRQAQGVLAGLTGCGRRSAARALRTTAQQLDLGVAAVARRFLEGAEHPDDGARDLMLHTALAAVPAGAGSGQASVVPGPGGVAVRGELDAAAAPLLDEAVPAAAGSGQAAGRGEVFTLDLSCLTWLDNTGVRALDALAARVHDAGPALRVIAPRSPGLASVQRFAVALRWLPPAFGTTSSGGTQPARAPAAPTRMAELESLYDSHGGACWSLARRLLRDDAEADAVVLAAFVEAFEHLASGDPLPGRIGAQLLRRTHRQAVLRLRGERRSADLPPDGGGATDPARPRGERQRSSRRPVPGAGVLAGLPGDEAHALRLAFWRGLTVQQIATATGTPPAGVRASMLAGVRALSRPD
jgi:RNA polymerase sigma-70 factor (ECF subfamily)